MNIINGIVNIAVLAPIAAVAVYAITMGVSTAAPMIIGSYKNHVERIAAVEKVDIAARNEYRTKFGAQVCEDYNNASWVTRTIGLKGRAWCEDIQITK